MIFMKLLLYFLAMFAFVSAGGDVTDKKCFGRYVHIMKLYKRSFGPDCKGKNPIMEKITPQMEAAILKFHNEKRDEFARGKLANFPQKVKRMASMKYDKELASYAELLAYQCLHRTHDDCHSTINFPYSGQNLAFDTKPKMTTHEKLMDSMNRWYSENTKASSSDIAKYSKGSSKKKIGHFTLMIHEYATAIGCAVLKTNGDYFSLICNYGAHNIQDRPICNLGAKVAGEGCKKKHSFYKGLCSENEDYSDTVFVNKI